MPGDKLILISRTVRPEFQHLVLKEGKPNGKYAACVDLQKSIYQLPVLLFCRGSINGFNKLEFPGAARLGHRLIAQAVRAICGKDDPRIYRVDWAVDLPGLCPWELAQSCHVAKVHSSRFYRSRGNVSFYPHFSRDRVILIYNKLKRIQRDDSISAEQYKNVNPLCRVEVQFRGRGVPIKNFSDIHGYADIDLLAGVSFDQSLKLKNNLKPEEILTASGIRLLVREVGLQNACRRFSASTWKRLCKKYFDSSQKLSMPDIHALINKSARDWLENRIRFPRLGA